MKQGKNMTQIGGGGAFNNLKNNGIAAEKSFAFTLAEVLIALAIIGVVAAMTIPTFMANTAGAQFRTGFKKGITVLTQAASANYATEGYDFSGTNGYAGATTASGDDAGGNPINQYDLTGKNAEGADAGTEQPAIIGFDSSSDASKGTSSDIHPDTPSLFHLFQNNLNMKNSKEITNYAVMPADAMLSCAGRDGAGATIKVPGSSVTSAEASTYAKKDISARQAYGKGSAIQTGGGLKNFCDGRSLDSGGFNQGRLFQLEDGMTFTYDGAQAYCSESNPCYGYIDVNGPTGPNRVISCSNEGGADDWILTYGRNAKAGDLLADCTVEAKDITDIYPVLFYGSAVKPASRAAKSVLYSKKSNQTTTETKE